MAYIFQRHVFGNGKRILNHTGLVTLHLANFSSLLPVGQVFMDDADAALLCQCNRCARLGNGIHRC